MARENNFLLGQGERLTEAVQITKGGGIKKPPYSFEDARDHAITWLKESISYYSTLPEEACPQDQIVAAMMLHPRYVSKSDFPTKLLSQVGLSVVGGRSRLIRPQQWGAKDPPDEVVTDELYVSTSRSQFQQWLAVLPTWTPEVPGATELQAIEHISAIRPEDKTRSIPSEGSVVLEVVLHGNASSIISAFERYVTKIRAHAITDRIRIARGLTFLPVEASVELVDEIAEFSFVRVVRAMPSLRPFEPGLVRRSRAESPFIVNDRPPINSDMRVVIFDGGISEQSCVDPWVTAIEPPGIGPRDASYVEHGLAVTSAFLFGPIQAGVEVDRPICHVDHVRVLDNQGDATGLYYDVLDRILTYLDENIHKYAFVNLSLGPNMPISDDDVTRWTAELDARFASGDVVATVAVGNGGEQDAESHLDRVQPPSDGVNVLSIGATDHRAGQWRRAIYSSVGPGRAPGVVKPDGVIFGGSSDEPFYIVTPYGTLGAQEGTSFAAPYALRSAVAFRAQLGSQLVQDDVSPLSWNPIANIANIGGIHHVWHIGGYGIIGQIRAGLSKDFLRS